MDPHDDEFRFYICVERKNRMNSYECTQVKYIEALTRDQAEGQRIITVPISKRVPRIIDFMYINNALKPTFNIVK
jgi:hypothetical protein